VLGLDALALEVARAVADRLGLARRARREDDQRRVLRAELHRWCRLSLVDRSAVGYQQLALEAGLQRELDVRLGGHDRPRLHPLHAGAQVGGAQLLGAGERHGAEAPAGDHREHPFGPVADQGHHHGAAPGAARGQGTREAGRALGHLAEGDLAPLAAGGEGHQGEAGGIGGVDDVAGEVHADEAGQRSPRLSRCRPTQA
jgi:hypothetical protein